MAVVDTGDEVGNVGPFVAVERVGDREAEVVVLDVADDLGHVFECLGDLLFPESVSATTWEMWHLSARVA